MNELAYLLVPAAGWLIVFLGTRLILPRVRKLGDGTQAMIALVVAALLSSAATHFNVILPDTGVISVENLIILLNAWLASMGVHTAVKKPVEEPIVFALRGPTEGFRD